MNPLKIPPIEGLTDEEQALYAAMVRNWRACLSKNRERTEHYRGNVNVARLDLGISVPPPVLRKLKRQSVMWSKKVVDTYVCNSVLNGYRFADDREPDGFSEVMRGNDVVDIYTQALPSTLAHCATLWTVTSGDVGEPPAIINAYDMEHATCLWDMRRKRVKCGLAIVDVDPKHPKDPTATNFYTEGGDVVECRLTSDGWKSERRHYGTGRCMMVCLRNNPDIQRPLGRSVLTNSILEIENQANTEAVKMLLHSELYTAPTRWIMGAPDDVFDNGRWQAYFGSIFAMNRDENGDAPTTGSYPVGDFTPHVSFMRQLANRLAAESCIPVHSLMYTETNPVSSEAIVAESHDLARRIEIMNRVNGASLREVGLLVCSLLSETPYDQLDSQTLSMTVDWQDPSRPSRAQNADAWMKYASLVPDLAKTRVYWEQQMLPESTVDRIMDAIERADAMSAVDLMAGSVTSIETAPVEG